MISFFFFVSYSKQLNVDEDVEDNVDEDNTSYTNSIDISEPSLHVASNNSSEERDILFLPLKRKNYWINR
jgi:hypothetical protein